MLGLGASWLHVVCVLCVGDCPKFSKLISCRSELVMRLCSLRPSEVPYDKRCLHVMQSLGLFVPCPHLACTCPSAPLTRPPPKRRPNSLRTGPSLTVAKIACATCRMATNRRGRLTNVSCVVIRRVLERRIPAHFLLHAQGHVVEARSVCRGDSPAGIISSEFTRFLDHQESFLI